MPHILRFHDTDDGTTFPDPSQVGHAAAWAAERGYWDIATCLMELAHALAHLETPLTAAGPLTSIGLRKIHETAQQDFARVADAPHCSHGYLLGGRGQHIATGGTCDDPEVAEVLASPPGDGAAGSWLHRAIEARRKQLEADG